MINKFLSDYNSWNKPLRKYFFFLTISWATIFLFLITLPHNVNIYKTNQWSIVISVVAFWFILWFLVRKATLRKCNEEGYDVTGKMATKEEGIGYFLMTMTLKNLGIKRPSTLNKDYADKKIKEFLKNGEK